MPRRSRFIAALAASALAAPAALRAQTPPIRIGASLTEIFGEPYYLADAGFLKNAGINAEIVPFTSGGAMIAATMGGGLEVGLSDMSQVANAYLKGLPIAFFAGSGLYRSEAPSTVLCVAKSSPIASAKDLEGQPIGVNGLRTMAEISTREWVHASGGDPDKLQFVEIPPALAMPALERGTIAAAIVGEPNIAAAGDAIRKLAKTYDWVAKSFYVSAFFARREWLDANAAVAKKLIATIYESARWANAHHAETAAILMTRMKADPEHLKNASRAAFATSLDPKLMQPVIDIAERYGLLEKPVDAHALIARVE